eukprot:EG_transcript_7354
MNSGDAPPARKPTPLPWGPLVWVCLVQFLDAFSTFLVVPFIPFMIRDFFPELPASEVGYYSGYLNSASFFGQLLGSPLWGVLSDKVGRKPVLLMGMVGTIFSLTMFAFSLNYAQAVAARFLWGFLNGNIGVIKTYVSEITDETNIARALGMIAMQYGFGTLLGPSIGGYLARPAERFAVLKGWAGDVFTRFPYALPCAVPFVVAVTVLVGIAFFLPESRTDYSTFPEPASPTSPYLLPKQKVTAASPTSADTESKFLLSETEEPLTRLQVLMSKKVQMAVILYAVMGGVQIGFSSIFAIWVINSEANGGFSMQSRDIGFVMSASAPVQLFWQPFVVPVLTAWLGFRRLFQCTALFFATLVFSTPFASLLSGFAHARFAILIFIWLSFTTACNTGFSTVFVLLANSAPKRLRGTVNGLAQTCVAATRITGPALFSNLFAWSMDHSAGWPLGHHLVFHILGAIAFGNFVYSLTLPTSVNSPLPEVRSAVMEINDEEEGRGEAKA